MSADFSTRACRVVRAQAGLPVVVFEAQGVACDPALAASPLPPEAQDGAWFALTPQGWELLARANGARAALFALLEAQDLNPLYPADVRAEVSAWAQAPGLDDPDLEDWLDLPFVTIDNDDSRDLDQAMHLSRDGQGYVVRYALADAYHYIRVGSALWRDALARGSSYYLPRLSVPMLPPVLSEDLVSLNPGVVRRALVFEMRLDPEGVSLKTRIARAKIQSRAKLSYVGVQAWFDGSPRPQDPPFDGQAFTETLLLLREVGQKRIREAERRDVVRYDRANLAVDLLGDAWDRFGVAREVRNEVERWNEQISLLCNGEGAAFLRDEAVAHPHVQPIFRIHEAPPAQEFEDAQAFVEGLIAAHKLDPSVWRWRPFSGGQCPPDPQFFLGSRQGSALAAGQETQGVRGTLSPDPSETVAEYLGRLPRDPDSARLRAAIEHRFMRINRRSVFSGEPGLHFALGIDPYSRFSAPMREIVGVFTHKEALEKLDPSRATASLQEDRALRELVIAAAHRSRALQRKLDKEIQKLAMDHVFADDLNLPADARPRRAGTVCGVSGSKVYVSLDDPPMELKLYAEDLAQLQDLALTLDDDGLRVYAGQRALRVGDMVRVYVGGYLASRGRWQMLLD